MSLSAPPTVKHSGKELARELGKFNNYSVFKLLQFLGNFSPDPFQASPSDLTGRLPSPKEPSELKIFGTAAHTLMYIR